MKVCPYCHRPVLDNAVRCSYPDCGRDISNIPSGPAPGFPSAPVSGPVSGPALGTQSAPGFQSQTPINYASSGFSGNFAPSVPGQPPVPGRPAVPGTAALGSSAPSAPSSAGFSTGAGAGYNSGFNSGLTPPPGFGTRPGLSAPPGFSDATGFQPASGFTPGNQAAPLNPAPTYNSLFGVSSTNPAAPASPSFRPAVPGNPAASVNPMAPGNPTAPSSPAAPSSFRPAVPANSMATDSFTGSRPGASPFGANLSNTSGTPNTSKTFNNPNNPNTSQSSGFNSSKNVSAPTRGEQRSAAPPLPGTANRPAPVQGQFGTNLPHSSASTGSSTGFNTDKNPGSPTRGEQRSVAPPLPGSPRSQFGSNLPRSGANAGLGSSSPTRGEQRSVAPPLPGSGANAGPGGNPMGERTSAAPPAPGMVSRLFGRTQEMTSAPPPAPGMAPPAYGSGERVSAAPPLARMRSFIQMGLPLSVPAHGAQSEAIPSSLLVIHDDDTPEQASLRETLRNLHGRVLRSRKNTKRLASAVWLVLGCILLSYFVFYSYTVGSYAEMSDGEIDVKRDKANPLELVISYKPASSGYIGFRRKFKDYSTEIFEKIDSADGLEKKFHWSGQASDKEEPLLVSFRNGVQLERQQFKIPQLNLPEGLAGVLASSSGSVIARTGRGVLTGQILSALDKKPIPGATVRVVGADIQTTTDQDGKFSLENIPEGENRIETSLTGYTTEKFNETVYLGNAKDIRVTMSPGLKEGQIRLVLTWNNSVQDLDAYLSGPKGNGENFRVSYSDKGNLQSNEFVSLDVDAQEGWGPETITILGVQPGEYEYQVHDFSNKDKPSSSALANAEARVKLYFGGQTYNFTPEKDLVGGVWNVCKIQVTEDRQVKVSRINTIIREEESSQKFGLYAKRTMADRSSWIGKYGGTQESERAVTLGLDWLCRHQADNGSWGKYCLKESGSSKHRCTDDSCTGCGAAFEMALTGLPLLAFQGGGHFYFNGNKYSDNVKQGLDWIVDHQAKNGLLISPSLKGKTYGDSPYHQYFMYEHGIASFALVEACAVAKSMGEDPDPKYYAAAKKALKFTQAQQYPDGGWRYWTADHLPREGVGDTSATGWQVLALKSGKEADIPIDPKVIEKLKSFFTKRFHGNGQTGYEDKSNWTQATTGIGMLARQFLFNEPDAVEVKLSAEYLANWAPSHWTTPGDPIECDCYEWYHTMLAMYQAGGREWARFNPVLRDYIIKQQKLEGCQAGSWDPIDSWGAQGGRIYSTAFGTLALEVYYRYAGAQERNSSAVTTVHTQEIVEAADDQDVLSKEEEEKIQARQKYAKEAKAEDAPEVDLGL